MKYDKPRGERDFIKRLRPGIRRDRRLRQVADEKKMRRDQHGFHRELHASLETVALFARRFIKFHQPVNFLRLDRASPRAVREIRDDGTRGFFDRDGIGLRSGGRNRMLREKFAQRRGHRRNQNRFAENGRLKIWTVRLRMRRFGFLFVGSAKLLMNAAEKRWCPAGRFV